jgi:ABC-type dipeptide/oligopeptide/nickel transport system ATPase component
LVVVDLKKAIVKAGMISVFIAKEKHLVLSENQAVAVDCSPYDDRLYNPTSGSVIFDGTDIAKLGEKELKPYRRRIQMIFQDPYASLDPRMTVRHIVAEPLTTQFTYARGEHEDRVAQCLRMVGLQQNIWEIST